MSNYGFNLINVSAFFQFFLYQQKLHTKRKCSWKKNALICVVAIVCRKKLMLIINQYLATTAIFSPATGVNISDCSHPSLLSRYRSVLAGWVGWSSAGGYSRFQTAAVGCLLLCSFRGSAFRLRKLCGWNTRRVMLDQRGADLSKLEKRWLDLHVTFSR